MAYSDKSIPLALMVGVLYMVYGAIQIYNGIIEWWLTWLELKPLQVGLNFNGAYIPNAFPEPFSGISLMIIGGVFLKAVYMYRKKSSKYKGFLFVGWVLALMMLVLNVTVIVADILDVYYPLIWGGEVGEWSLAKDVWGVAPHLVIGIVALPIYLSVKEMIKELIPGRYGEQSEKKIK